MKFYVGDYTHLGGPGVCECELAEGALRFVQAADTKIEDPTYLILSGDGKTLFATSSSPADGEEGGSVATFDVSDGGLRLTSMHSTAGGSACHLTLSPDERFLYVANYNDGKLTVFPVSEGKVGKRIQLIQHEGHGPNPNRQECPHVHFVAFHPEDGRLYAVDLGLDAVMIYRQDAETGLLTLDERVDVPAGMGPRHLVFHNNMMYVAHELGGAVSVFRASPAGWQLEQTLSTLPEGGGSEGAVAAIRLLADRVYVSNRENDDIAEFEIRMGGSLVLARNIPTFGNFPRDFLPLEEGLFLVANQNSGDIRLIAAAPLNYPRRQTFRMGMRAILGEHVSEMDLMSGGVFEACDPLALPGAVCICPAKA